MRHLLDHQRELRQKLTRGRRGLRAVPINPAMLLDLFKKLDGSRLVKINGLPPDVQIERVEVDRKSGQIVFVVNSSLFPACAENCPIAAISAATVTSWP